MAYKKESRKNNKSHKRSSSQIDDEFEEKEREYREDSSAQNDDFFPERKDITELEQAIFTTKNVIYKEYYKDLCNMEVYPLKESNYNLSENADYQNLVKLFNLKKITYRKDEDILQKLTNVFNSCELENSSLMIIIDTVENKPIDMHIGAVSEKRQKLTSSTNAIKAGIKANFPGTILEDKVDEKQLFSDIGEFSDIACVSAIGSIRDNSKSQKKEFLQGFEKLIDAIQGISYTGIFIAKKVKDDDLTKMIAQHESLYTTISQFKKNVLILNSNESKTFSESATKGLTKTLTDGFSRTIGGSASVTATTTVNGGVGVVNAAQSISGTASANYSSTRNTSTSDAKSMSSTAGLSLASSYGKSMQIEIEDKSISQMLETLDMQLKRLREAEDYGMYEVGAYFLSSNKNNVSLAANTYRSIITGQEVSCECDAINIWSNSQQTKEIKKYLFAGLHPLFGTDEKFKPSVYVSGLMLPLHMGFPQKSVSGVTVIEHAEFGRNILTNSNEEKINIGNLYHMGLVNNVPIEITKKNLSAHTFITGSTGSGKSNAVYKMLSELCKESVKFMVIEPAKGEYKDVFGGRKDVTVYGTNPYKYPNLLGLNPFSFPKDIHVLEHIDRLVEIFNACWPMYAAMPAILKDAIEQSYEECGWNLRTSKGSDKFPTFETLLNILPKVIDTSNYSSDTSSDYKGALVTRVRSLTKGINGIIFENDIEYAKLFNANVIVDLSRIGSNETKSLIMGILVLKLQEFRMSENTKNNSELRHITVLEEAHNLLKRTSSEQSQDSSNLQGKSVEMIANAIAEMRTYGEGFIIADQSPGLMDMSVIRNTNTKIIMRLPDESDRELVGKAAGLNDDQIVELAKLDTGVAAIYQNSWLEPILCKVDYFNDVKPLEINEERTWNDDKGEAQNKAIKAFLNNAFDIDKRELTSEEVDIIRKWKDSLVLSDKKKQAFEYVINQKSLTDSGKMCVLYGIAPIKGIAPRATIIDTVNQKLKSFGFDNDCDIIEVINEIISRNIAEVGSRNERAQVM